MLLELLVKLYRYQSPPSSLHDIDLIAPLSYTTLREKLTNGTRESLRRALAYKREFPAAILAFTNARLDAFPHLDQTEYELKKKLLNDTPHICAASAPNSVGEAEAVRDAIPFSPKRILVVCGEAHSRGARIIWRQVFPAAEILVRCMPFAYEYQRDYPFPVERRAWIWFCASLARHILLRLLSLDQMRKLQHSA